jgi:hypothetical protein
MSATITPGTISAIYSGVSALSSGVSAIGQYQQGQAQRAAYEQNAEIIKQNTEEKQMESEAKYANLLGKQRSLYAKAGVDISSGSPLLVMAATAMQEGEESASIKEAGEMAAAQQQFAGDVAAFQGDTGAMSTFVTGLNKAAFGYKLRKAGVMTPWLQ